MLKVVTLKTSDIKSNEVKLSDVDTWHLLYGFCEPGTKNIYMYKKSVGWVPIFNDHCFVTKSWNELIEKGEVIQFDNAIEFFRWGLHYLQYGMPVEMEMTPENIEMVQRIKAQRNAINKTSLLIKEIQNKGFKGLPEITKMTPKGKGEDSDDHLRFTINVDNKGKTKISNISPSGPRPDAKPMRKKVKPPKGEKDEPFE